MGPPSPPFARQKLPVRAKDDQSHSSSRRKLSTHGRSLSIMSIGQILEKAIGSPRRPPPLDVGRGHNRAVSLSSVPQQTRRVSGVHVKIPQTPQPDKNTFEGWGAPPTTTLDNTQPRRPPIYGRSDRGDSYDAHARPPTGSRRSSGRSMSMRREGEDDLSTKKFVFPPPPASKEITMPAIAVTPSPPPVPILTEEPEAEGEAGPEAPASSSVSTELGFQRPTPIVRSRTFTEQTDFSIASEYQDSEISSMPPSVRPSIDLYSMANSSNNNSVYSSSPTGVGHRRPSFLQQHSRNSSLAVPPRQEIQDVEVEETLLMGYAQLHGSFIVDESLVQASSFTDIKKRSIIGTSSGGGVIGIKKSTSSWGLRALSGFLGGGGQSTVKEMTQEASARDVPVLATPQSILFVDLRLGPGESRTYSYTFQLPRELPPTHKGKALKITYNLVIGVQKPGTQGVGRVEVPFRVFANVNEFGKCPVYDMLSPFVLLRDTAVTACVGSSNGHGSGESSPVKRESYQAPTARDGVTKQKKESTYDDFKSYVADLLDQSEDSTANSGRSTPRRPRLIGARSGSSLSINTAMQMQGMGSYHGQHERIPRPLKSPSQSRRQSFIRRISCREAIEEAIRGGGIADISNTSTYDLARNGVRVGHLTLARPAYKLGETITASLDFRQARIKCHHIRVTLESCEIVDPVMSAKSRESVMRATRKVWGEFNESVTAAERVGFGMVVPLGGTPGFSTSGVSQQWSLRLEFVTPSPLDDPEIPVEKPTYPELLEPVHSDDRGTVMLPPEQVHCNTFDCSIPLIILPTNHDTGLSMIERDRPGMVGDGYAI
ncbi:hypothetical protein G7K_2162-t1 [Saitoella complicata NRRL Y-17804]|uniref:Rgp1-domain-containing protein n=1 Tax=Saitoella complicata (strain BCRC 22490 / CBS 7301 / JCM 7358 / NBRC 10748 / NRRL Y-17804) TaxID=698492 RepID=A0A0E9NEZ4_SAICN|nr:hypothetical protein G7K_2162-t1 [Saitoella complicata NRRL Y-17804]